jgi:cytoskeletal protein CcmA (bactofilin family)
MNAPNEQNSTLLSDVEITGTMTFKGQLTFDGQLRDGDIAGDSLILGPKSKVTGNIQVASLVLHGSVTGDVLVTSRCELKGSANLVGSLTTNRLVMDEGATMIGRAEITPDTKSRPAPPKEASPASSFPPGVASLRPNKP